MCTVSVQKLKLNLSCFPTFQAELKLSMLVSHEVKRVCRTIEVMSMSDRN